MPLPLIINASWGNTVTCCHYYYCNSRLLTTEMQAALELELLLEVRPAPWSAACISYVRRYHEVLRIKTLQRTAAAELPYTFREVHTQNTLFLLYQPNTSRRSAVTTSYCYSSTYEEQGSKQREAVLRLRRSVSYVRHQAGPLCSNELSRIVGTLSRCFCEHKFSYTRRL